MNKNLKLLRDIITDHELSMKHRLNYDFLDRSEKYPRSELVRFQTDKFGGEIAIYELGTNYCEYELLIFKGEKFYSKHEEFHDKDELAIIINKFLDEINENTGP